jgi:hypothetical protein
MATATIKIQVRRDTLANWDNANPVLLIGEIGFITDRDVFFIGDGVTDYQNIGAKLYYNISDTSAIIDSKVAVETANRLAAELVLTTAINNEVSARVIADSVLAADISNETLNRETADIVLQSNIDTETSIRDAADVLLQTNIDNVLPVSSNTGIKYLRDDNTWANMPSNPELGFWNFSTTTTDSDPGAGKFRLNASTRAAATKIYLNKLTDGNVDVAGVLNKIALNDTIYIQDENDSSKNVRYKINGATVISGNYYKLSVEVDIAPVGGEFSNNQLHGLAFRIAAIGGVPATPVSLYEEITIANYQAMSAAGTLVAGKTYAITDLLTIYGAFRLLLQGFNNATNNGITNGVLISLNTLSSTPTISVLDVQFDIVNGVFLSFYNRAHDVRFTSTAILAALNTAEVGNAFYNGRIKGCDFSNYTGTLTFDISNNTTLLNCDFSNSTADFDTTELTVAATFSGRILNNFVVPNQTSYPCDFTNTIQINADGTNNMMATITLAVSQTTLDYTGFESAGIVNLIPEATTGNPIGTIINAVEGREYKIISPDTNGYLLLGTGVNIIIPDVLNLFYYGVIQWNTSNADHHEVFFKYNGSEILILSKTNTYP